MKKLFILPVVILIILSLFSAPALAKNTSEKGKPTATPEPTDIPDFGELYGDLYVILRDVDGAPILDENECIQPIANDSQEIFTTTIETIDGIETITAYAGEPFQLPYYTDIYGDLVECELTEDMALWVQTVDFGRLNLGRAPDAVIDHAFDEAINKFNLASQMAQDPSGRIMLLIEGEWFTIDAPAENLALYIKMMTDGHWITPEGTPTSKKGGDPAADDVYRPTLSPDAITMILNYNPGYSNLVDKSNTTAELGSEDLLLAASLLAGAGDKFGVITLDMVIYINSIYEINPSNGFFNFSGFHYGDFGGRAGLYGSDRGSLECTPGEIYVLQPVIIGGETYYKPGCESILDNVQFNDYIEDFTTPGVDNLPYTDNVRGFTQAADDSLQVLEYVHNYEVPEDIYAGD